MLDNEYLWGLVWRERKDLSIALLCALLCTVSNLAAPVISGYFIEILAGRQPASLYPKVRPCRPAAAPSQYPPSWQVFSRSARAGRGSAFLTTSFLSVQLLAVMGAMYTIEPLLGRIYAFRAVRALERALTTVRAEVFRVLLMQPIAFFDTHGASELTNVLAVDLDTIRACVFGCAPVLTHLGPEPSLTRTAPRSSRMCLPSTCTLSAPACLGALLCADSPWPGTFRTCVFGCAPVR